MHRLFCLRKQNKQRTHRPILRRCIVIHNDDCLRTRRFISSLFLVWALLCVHSLQGDMVDELKVKRESVFEFAQKPTVKQEGDKATITFKTKGLCDVTVVVEGKEGNIIRHLASGVLGSNAPEPFIPDSKKQSIVWDGKNDFGRYVDNKSAYRVRVSLGLKPQFEKTLFWHPKKRNGVGRNPMIVPQPEGVYVYEGDGVEQIRLFGHDGNYIRTIYPFSARTVKNVKGLKWRTLPDGYKAPEKIGYWNSTFLLGGLARTDTGPGDSARAFTVNKGAIAVVAERLTRLAAKGASVSWDIYGPEVRALPARGGKQPAFQPKSAAFSPDNTWLYFTGYYENRENRLYGRYAASIEWNHAVYRMKWAENKPAEVWLGKRTHGSDTASFHMPTSVCVDAKGRIYVADNRNDRIQVFNPAGKLVRSIPISAPAVLQIHHETQELYVFSWAMMGRYHETKSAKAVLRILGPLENSSVRAEIPLPLHNYGGAGRSYGGCQERGDELPYRMALDSWTDPATIWMCPAGSHRTPADLRNIHLYTVEKGKLKLKQQWQKEVVKTVKRWNSAITGRQRLYVDPTNGTIYVGEGDSGVSKAFTRVVRINPDSEEINIIELPMSTEDMAIDARRHCYLRTTEVIGRFDLRNWREVPFDYGEERRTQFSYDCKGATLVGALYLPSQKPVWWHQQGFDVNFNGDLAVFCVSKKGKWRKQDGRRDVAFVPKSYLPKVFPGRYSYGELHVFDKYGKAKTQDLVQGIPDGHGTCIDPNGDVYLLVRGPRVYGDNKVFGGFGGTLAKFKGSKGGRYLSSRRTVIPLTDQTTPERPPDLKMSYQGAVWIEGAEWLYSGVGFCRPGPCQCWNCRFALDYLGRSFVPENLRSQFAVLDTNGNLIMRIGRYGNVDDGKPLSPAKLEPPNQRSMGGDEVSLMYANYPAVHTDKRLFIADTGNMRILSVRLNYHMSHTTILNDSKRESGK